MGLMVCSSYSTCAETSHITGEILSSLKKHLCAKVIPIIVALWKYDFGLQTVKNCNWDCNIIVASSFSSQAIPQWSQDCLNQM